MATIITDCIGIKQDAITGVLKGGILKDQPFTVKVFKEKDFPTPMTWEDFFLTTAKRLQYLTDSVSLPERGEGPWIFATLQKGYYRKNGMWYLSCCAGIVSSGQQHITPVMGASVPVGKKASDAKNIALEKNMTEILHSQNPSWDHKSVFALLTKEDEKMWLQQPLRYFSKSIL